MSNPKNIAKELHKPARKNFPRRPVQVSGIDDTWAIDLVDMSFNNNEKIIKQNQGFRYMITCIDVLSRYAWAVPLKTKDADTVLAAVKHIIRDSGRRPLKLWADEGSEFKGVFRKHFKLDKQEEKDKADKYSCPYSDTCGYKSKVPAPTLIKHLKSRAHHFSESQIEKLKDHNFKLTIAEIDRGDKKVESDIPIYHTYSDFHASPVERFNRTLKTRMWYKFSKHDTKEWISRLDKLLRKYNNTIHSATGMTPAKASQKENEERLLTLQKRKIDKIEYREPKLELGDLVRLSKVKKHFEKGYTQNWSQELFRVVEVNYSRPITYRVEDMEGNLIHGSFYEEELQRSGPYPSPPGLCSSSKARLRGPKLDVVQRGKPRLPPKRHRTS